TAGCSAGAPAGPADDAAGGEGSGCAGSGIGCAWEREVGMKAPATASQSAATSLDCRHILMSSRAASSPKRPRTVYPGGDGLVEAALMRGASGSGISPARPAG